MKILKRLLLAVFIFLLLAIGFLVAAPWLFRDQIEANIKASAEKSLHAKVDFSSINLSFFRSFPDIYLGVNDLAIVGVDTFAQVPLVRAERIGVDLGFWSVVAGEGNYVIDAVTLDRPDLNLLVIDPELANYLIVPESDPATTTDPAPASAQINLQHFTLNDARLVYDDRSTATYLRLDGLNGEGDGDFSATVFDLLVGAQAKALTLRQGGTTYLNAVAATFDGLVNIDLDESRYTFRENTAVLNALQLVFAGSIDLEDNGDIFFDLDYSAPANDFRQLWSLVPSAYTAGYEQVKTTGTFTLSGSVDGPYNGDKEQYPAFTLNTEITGGGVRYPGRPLGIDGINARVSVNSPSSDFNQLTVNIPRFDFNLGDDPFRGRLQLATLLRDPRIDGRIDGRIDLGKWQQAVPLEGIRELSGLLTADLTFDGIRQSLVESGRYDNLELGGKFQLTDFVYRSDAYPALLIDELDASVTPRMVTIKNFAARPGRSDVNISGTINNPLAYFSPEQTLRGDLLLRSGFFDADEWLPAETETPVTASPAELETATASATETLFDRFSFNIDAAIDALAYAGYRPEKLRAIGSFSPEKLNLATASATLGESDFTASGRLTDLFDYTFGTGVLGGNISLRSRNLNLDDFMDDTVATTPEGTPDTATETAVIPIPDNINLTLDFAAENIQYTDIQLQETIGNLLVKDGRAIIDQGSAALLGGRMKFAGAYDTSVPGDPGFRFHYDLQSLDFQKAFAALNSFAALAPLGKFLEGKFSNDLVISGKLGPDLFPRLNTIDAEGLFRTAEAQLTRFRPVEKIGEALDIQTLKQSTTLRNLKTAFAIQDGQVIIQPFRMRLAGIPLKVQGKHGLNQDMDYEIEAAVPRDLIQGNIVTGTALTALDQLAGQAGKLGLNISPGDTLNVAINLGGSITDPSTRFRLLGTNQGEGQSVGGAIVDNLKDQTSERIAAEKEKATAEAEARIAAAKAAAEARADSLRRVAGNRAQAAQDSIQRAIAAETEKLRRQAAEKLRLRLDSIRLDSIKNSLPPEVKDAADEVRERLRRFNPFGKKTDGQR